MQTNAITVVTLHPPVLSGLSYTSNLLLAAITLLHRYTTATQYDARSALEVCRAVFSRDPHNSACMPTYIACLLELHMKSQLFFTAHQLADEAPGLLTVSVTLLITL
jgi:hypothetical protein